MDSLLSYRANIFDVSDICQEQRLKEEIGCLDSRRIEETPEDELVLQIASQFKMEIPVLEDDKAEVAPREVDVDVSRGDPMRMIFPRGRSPFYVKDNSGRSVYTARIIFLPWPTRRADVDCL